MNKRGFTLIELLAVIVILSVVTLIAAPNVMKTKDDSNRRLYVVDAKTFVTAATYMYVQERYLTDENYFTKKSDDVYAITLDKIDTVNTTKDPYGYIYDKKNSYITFIEPTSSNGFNAREVSVYIKSCSESDPSKCHCISGNGDSLTEDLVDSCLDG